MWCRAKLALSRLSEHHKNCENFMHIKKIEIFGFELPVKGKAYTMAKTSVTHLDTTLVKITADNGLVGWGETCPVGPLYAEAHARGAHAALAQIAPGLIGCQILPLDLHRQMDDQLKGHHYAKAAIDIALYDVMGKHLNLPVSSLLGGAQMARIPSYFATGVDSPDEIARLVKEKVKEGYPRIQVKIGGRAVEEDIETVKKVWEVIKTSGVSLAVDGNRGLPSRDTIRLSQACQDIPFVMEQPTNTIDELRIIRPLVSHAIYMDESGVNLNTVIRAASEGLVDGFGMKVTRLGGLMHMITFREVCDALSLPHTCDDSWGGDIIAAACTHIGATVKADLNEGVWLAEPYISTPYDKDGGIKIVDGHITLPTGPGLGIQPDEALFGPALACYD